MVVHVRDRHVPSTGHFRLRFFNGQRPGKALTHTKAKLPQQNRSVDGLGNGFGIIDWLLLCENNFSCVVRTQQIRRENKAPLLILQYNSSLDSLSGTKFCKRVIAVSLLAGVWKKGRLHTLFYLI